MKYLILIFCIFSFLTIQAQKNEKLQIRITDIKYTPIYGAYIIKQPGSLLINITDENGICEISPSLYKPGDKIILYSMGYISDTLSVSSIKEKSLSIQLKEKIYELEEVQISQQAVSLSEIIKEATKKIEKTKHSSRDWMPRFFGKSIFSKLTECKGHPVQIRREAGIFITSGNVRKEVKRWDIAYDLYFLSEFSARSFDFAKDGKDTLKRKYVYITNSKKRDVNYDVTCFPKIYNSMRALYLFGPIFSKEKYFDYKLINESDTSYLISYATRRKYYPQSNKVLSKGKVEIRKNTLQLIRMEIEHFADERFEFKINQTYSHPYQKKMKIQFAYAPSGECYIKNGYLETIWLYEEDNNKKIGSREGNPRPHPARDQLVEKEYWNCCEYLPFPKTEWKNKELKKTLIAIHSLPEGRYNKSFFDHLSKTKEFIEAEKTLSTFKPMEEQYKYNSNKLYNELHIYTETQLKRIREIRKSLIKYFNKKTCNEK